MDSEYNLERYLNISNYLERLEQRKQLIQKELYQRTLATHLTYDELSIHVQAPRIDSLVSDCLEACGLIDRRIIRWCFRQKCFNQFLSSLPVIERESLIQGLGNRSLNDRALDEIREIETAVAFRYGYEPPEAPIELKDDLFLDIGLLAEVL
ncbi:hypothetical protein ACQKTA_09075 [Enterococcus sp. 22-H-5-01]|uniref:hypothetical protein n=1 Tax=Enterococcus sp. 22-H-5-01 TaxID=3418555 RepID=UPI003D08F63E